MSATTELKEQLRAGFLACRKVVIGDTLHIISPDLAEPMIKKALSKGKIVTENGTSTWIETHEVIRPGQSGSDVYFWRGDKIKVIRRIMKRHPDGFISQHPLGFAWRSPGQ